MICFKPVSRYPYEVIRFVAEVSFENVMRVGLNFRGQSNPNQLRLSRAAPEKGTVPF